MKTIIKILKKETVLVIATVLAIISAFFITPSKSYINYIDFKTLGVLLSLMVVMAGFQKNDLFAVIANKLLKRTKTTMQLSFILVLLPFFFSMLITNDVALLTFVPFAILILKQSGNEKLLIPVIVLQTVAANMGSMVTPIGNPQNLYLYNLTGIGVSDFISIMLPYAIISCVAIALGVVLFCRNGKINMEADSEDDLLNKEMNRNLFVKNICYLSLFIFCLMVVGDMLPFAAVLATVIGVTFFIDRDVLKTVDYCLILTFIAFFIFTGNLGEMEVVKQGLQKFIEGREILTAVIASQCISNVPATLLLSGFTDNYVDLLKGVNIGGLGTLIASMASLISYKIYAHNYNDTKGKYFLFFTIANVVLLLILLAL